MCIRDSRRGDRGVAGASGGDRAGAGGGDACDGGGEHRAAHVAHRHRRLHRPGRADRRDPATARRRRGQPGPARRPGDRGGRQTRHRQDHPHRARRAPALLAVPGGAALRRPARRHGPPGQPDADPGAFPAHPRCARILRPGRGGGTRRGLPWPALRPADAGRAGQRRQRGAGPAAAAGQPADRGADHQPAAARRYSWSGAHRRRRLRLAAVDRAARPDRRRAAGAGGDRGGGAAGRAVRPTAAGTADRRGTAVRPAALDGRADGRAAGEREPSAG